MRCSGSILASVIFLGLAPGAEAQITDVICDTQARLEARLLGVVGAERAGRGMRGPNALIEIWIDRRSGDWTLVQSYPNGTSCIVAIGKNWESFAPRDEPA